MRILTAVILLFLLANSAQASGGDTVEQCMGYRNFIAQSQAGEVRAPAVEERVAPALLCAQLTRHAMLLLEQDLHKLQREIKSGTANAQAQTERVEMELRLGNYREQLAEIEEDLREYRKRLDKTIAQHQFCDVKRIACEDQYLNIQRYFNIPEYERLHVDHNDYERYFFKLSLGFEYTSISGLLEQGAARIGMLIYQHNGRRAYFDEYGLGFYGFDTTLNLILSGASEQALKDTGTESSPAPLAERTLGIDATLFFPFLRTKLRTDLSLLNGPVASIGATQTDQTTHIRTRSYLGWRSATNPEHLIEILFGHSPGLRSNRLEVRGQMPAARLGEESRLYIGAVANMGLEEYEDESDRVSVYVSWNIDFLDLFTPGSK